MFTPTVVHYNLQPLTCFEADAAFPSDEDGVPGRPAPATALIVSMFAGRIVQPYEITWDIPNALEECLPAAPSFNGDPCVTIATARIPGLVVRFRMFD